MKKILTMLPLLLLLSARVTAFSEVFSGGNPPEFYTVGTDIRGSGSINRSWITVSGWAWETVDAFFNAGLMPKELCETTDFTAPVTCRQICHLFYSVLLKKGYYLYEPPERHFDDCYDAAAEELAQMGIIKGTGERRLEPERTLTREEIAVIVHRMIVYMDAWTDTRNYRVFSYRDDEDISDWAKEAVYELHESRIMMGTGRNRFGPKELCTIEQAVKTASEVRLFPKTRFNNNVFIEAYESGRVCIRANGREVDFYGSEPFVKDKTVYIPLSALPDMLICSVYTDIPGSKAEITFRDGRRICMSIGENELTVGDRTVGMTDPVIRKNDMIYIPVKYLGESLGLMVSTVYRGYWH